MLLDIANGDSPVVHQPARAGEQARSCIDPGLARQVLGWMPSASLREGLAETLAWFQARVAAQPMETRI
jgi:UDP-glucose 4-epimerase